MQIYTRFLVLFTSFLGCLPLFSQSLLEIVPITDQLIVVHLDEGSVQYHGIGQTYQDDQIFSSPLDTNLAITAASYTISSTDDAAYTSPQAPSEVWRKSKGTEWTSVWPSYPYASEHWLYLKLPVPMTVGKSYTVNIGSLVNSGSNSQTLSFDPTQHRSEAVHINQIGFRPDETLKIGYVYLWMGNGGGLDLTAYDQTPFHLVDGNDQIAFSGQLRLRKIMDAASENFQGESSYYGADVWECDFSSFQSPGTYRLVVEKIGSSFPFTIEEDVYRDAFYTTTRGLFHHRSGIERTASHSAWVKPIDHRPGVNGFSAEYSGWRYMDGENAFDSLPVYSTGQLMPNAWGGWMDAADFDRNSRHMIAANLLLFSYSLHPDHFTDGELNIPESGNGIPDIIDEAKFCIDLFRRLIGPTGGICGGLEATDHPAPGQTSWTDTLDWYVYAEEPQSSFILAASAAQLAHSLELAGITDSTTQLLSEATAAYTWAQNNLQTGDIGICKADRMHAAAWLYKMTADATYQTDFENDAADLMATSIDPNEKNIHQAVWVYLNTDHSNVNLNLQSSLEAQFFAMVDQFYVDVAEARACRMAYNIYSPSVLGIGFTTPQIFPLIMAYELSGDPTYKQYISTSCDYTLGGNPLNMTWVTGLGARWPRNVANLDSWFDDIEDVLPGIVPYAIYKPAWAWNNGGVFSPGYGHASAWPNDVFNWPIHELYFDQRYSWITSEYTVWQNIGPAAAAYAYLVGEADASTRVDDVAESLIWTVSPNPVSGKELHISFGQNTPNGFAWEVLDVQGKSILKGNRQWMQDFDIVLPTDMTPAVYVLQLRAENLLVSKKILIQ